MVGRAAEYGVDIISTYVFSPKEERRYVDAIHRAIADVGGETYRVQLRPSLKALASRAQEPSRIASLKLSDATDVDDATRVFDALAEGGSVTQKLEPTFFSPAFGMCTDSSATVVGSGHPPLCPRT